MDNKTPFPFLKNDETTSLKNKRINFTKMIRGNCPVPKIEEYNHTATQICEEVEDLRRKIVLINQQISDLDAERLKARQYFSEDFPGYTIPSLDISFIPIKFRGFGDKNKNLD